MARLYYGNGEAREEMIYVKTYLEKLWTDGYGDGDVENGLFTYIHNFRTISKEKEKQDNERHRANSWKLNLIMALLAALAAVGTWAGVLYTLESIHRGNLVIPRIFQLDTPIPTVEAHERPAKQSAAAE